MAANEMSGDVYYPSEDIVNNAHIPDYDSVNDKAVADLTGFWDEIAKENFEWYAPWHTTLDDSNAPFYKWFVGAETNIVHNALDRHMHTATRNKAAIIFEGEGGDERIITYHQLNRLVCKFSNVLRDQGVVKGDVVTIYMGNIPETAVAMLACAKIGAMHSVVFGGFSSEALLGRIEDSKSKMLITCDGAWRRGKIVDLKAMATVAAEKSTSLEKMIVVQRTNHDVEMKDGRDFWYHDLMADASDKSETARLSSEDNLFILYTSGTTGRPKAILHTHGGYMVYTATTLKWVFDLKDEDVWWCAADPGWITGHSYIVYSPLVNGATSIMYEGTPDYPTPERWWQLVQKYGITILYTSPTAIRGLMKYGSELPKKYDLSSLRLLGSVGEPINPAAWKWYYEHVGNSKAPIMDTWWQTETGGFMMTPLPSVPLKPGSATRGFPGILPDVVDKDGNSVKPGEEGTLVIKGPWPSMLRTIYGDDERYLKQYWSEFKEQGWYCPSDSAKKDEDGYIWVIGRQDDVINVAGHRLGTAEIESALVSHPAVAEAAVVGLPDDVKGTIVKAFCIVNQGNETTPELGEALRAHVGKEIGAIAKPASVAFVDSLPKTRSGKIMRRVLKAQELGEDVGDLSTLAD